MFIGSIIGQFIPMLWGDGGLSMSGLIISSLGALVGIYVGYKISQRY